MTPADIANAAVIEAEIAWFSHVLDRRFRLHSGDIVEEASDLFDHCPPPVLYPGSAYADSVMAASLAPPERLVLILALLPDVRPHALDAFLIGNDQIARPFTEFGGVSSTERGFRPTWETALFLIAGERLDRRLATMRVAGHHRQLHTLGILKRDVDASTHDPTAPLAVAATWLGRLTGTAGTAGSEASLGADVPAQRLRTEYDWPDLVLPSQVADDLEDMVAWIENERTLLDGWGLGRHVRPGYRALFHGPPGTGKTMTASVLGKRVGRPVYRVDLARVVSKWIGETEKNLAILFDRAASGDLILFFDEADALFGRRGETTTANDRHANQQIGYLLQRIEDTPGVIILATNLRSQIDHAFARRFQASIHFPAPDLDARRALWTRICADIRVPAEGLDVDALAKAHEITGAEIVGAVRLACVRCLQTGTPVTQAVLDDAVEAERRKSGRLS